MFEREWFATCRSYPLLLIVSTVTDTTGQWAAGSPPEKLANIVPGNPPLYINDVTRIPLADHTFASVSGLTVLLTSSYCLQISSRMLGMR